MPLTDGRQGPRGVFVNTDAAKCSIHLSGRMVLDCLTDNSAFSLEYVELSGLAAYLERMVASGQRPDFWLFNWHHITMASLDVALLAALPGKKFTVVLEVLPDNPLPHTPHGFDGYLVLDPTQTRQDKIFPFPRPLPPSRHMAQTSWTPDRRPIIGSFGFPTPGKGFEFVVDAVNREFDQALVRFNIPDGDYVDGRIYSNSGESPAKFLGNLLKSLAKPGIEVEVGYDFIDDEALIDWCAGNDLNLFLYSRKQAGLAATTDQAIVAGKPLLVSDNPTFRHIHPYIRPYPQLSLREALLGTQEPVWTMQKDWSRATFASHFVDMLDQTGLLRRPKTPLGRNRAGGRPEILFVSHKARQCGIGEYGRNCAEALALSDRYHVRLLQTDLREEFDTTMAQLRPEAVIFNHYPFTMPWLNENVTKHVKVPKLGILHEFTDAELTTVDSPLFDMLVVPHPFAPEGNRKLRRIPRLVPDFSINQMLPDVLTIGSFGFGFPDKGFPELVTRVQQEFDHAVIRLLVPANEVVPHAENQRQAVLAECYARLYKPGIRLEIIGDFLDRTQVLEFLAGNMINVFCYAQEREKGISSVPDLALACGRPLAVSSAPMFRHLRGASPSIDLNQTSIQQIIANGIAPLVPFAAVWRQPYFLRAWEDILDEVLGRKTGDGFGLKTNQLAVQLVEHQNNPINQQFMPVMANSAHAQRPKFRHPLASPPADIGSHKDVIDRIARHPSYKGRAVTPGTIGKRFNRILDDFARVEFEPLVAMMRRVAPEIMARKIDRANVQQAFIFDTVAHFAARFHQPAILCVGAYEDTACIALERAAGLAIDKIDPALNFDLAELIAHDPSTLGKYDIVFSTSVLEHVVADEQFCADLARVTKPGGIITLTTDFNPYFKPGMPKPDEDYRLYTEADFIQRLLPAMANCTLVDHQDWNCPSPDFEYHGHWYAFATMTLKKSL